MGKVMRESFYEVQYHSIVSPYGWKRLISGEPHDNKFELLSKARAFRNGQTHNYKMRIVYKEIVTTLVSG